MTFLYNVNAVRGMEWLAPFRSGHVLQVPATRGTRADRVLLWGAEARSGRIESSIPLVPADIAKVQ